MGAKEFSESLVKLVELVKKNPRMSEGEVYKCIGDSRFFEKLNYKATGIDIRVQKRGEEGKTPDYEALDDLEQSIFILEVKRPSDEDIHPLDSYVDTQLKRYARIKKPRIALLTNGIKLYAYKRLDQKLIQKVRINDLSEITNEDSRKLYNLLKKPSYEYTDLKQIAANIKTLEPKTLTEEANRETFYEIFKLSQTETGIATKFTRLVYSLMDLFDELQSGSEKSEFLNGAYQFWLRSYAHKPSKVPENWKMLQKLKAELKNEESLNKFMFCLETAHNIVAKLLLAKVCEDLHFRNINTFTILTNYMDYEYMGEGKISPLAYPFAVKGVFQKLRENLVEKLFEDDIFDWWTDCSILVGETPREWQASDSYQVENFGLSLARIFYALRAFDFHGVEEDILGELYQRYFDTETRKALGEFYTPIEVVEYILDAVDYKGQKILNQRLLDPACGSGTFIVHSLRRYLYELEKFMSKTGKEDILPYQLRDLCERPKIVGFDINPFATLMAEIRFMMEIIPYYVKVQEVKPDFILTNIPIFRTDSLEKETQTGRFQKQLGEYGEEESKIRFSMRLPVISKESEEQKEQFIPMGFDIPIYEIFKNKKILRDKESYFMLLRISFKVIKDHVRNKIWDIRKENLEKEYLRHFDDADILADIMQDHMMKILLQIKILRTSYSDGRLIQTIEDLVLAGILKNYFEYDYVVGNPPYVRKEKIGSKYKYEKNYPEIYHGDNDICVYFINRGITWLNKNGKFGYIVSGKFAKTRYGKYIRAWIPLNTHMKQIIDLRGSKVFSGVTVDPIILVTEKTKKKTIDVVSILEDVQGFDWLDKLRKLLVHIKQYIGSKHTDFLIDSFKVSQVNLLENLQKENNRYFLNEWKLISDEKLKVYNKIKTSTSTNLKSFGEIYYTIKPGRVDILVLSNEKARKFKLEPEILKPVLRGEHIKKYRIDYSNEYLIFPYLKINNEFEVINIHDYRNLEKYLTPYKEELAERYDIKKNSSRWYELRPCDYYEIFERKKIITPDISTENSFALDEEGFYCLDTCFVFSPKKQYENKLKYLLGLLNSSTLEFYFKQISSYLGKKGYRYKRQYLKQLPIKFPENKKEQNLTYEITELVERILVLAEKEQHVENFPEPYFEELGEEIEEWSKVKWTPKRNYKEAKIKVEKDLEGENTLIFGKDDYLIDPAIDSEIKLKYAVEALKGKKARKDKEINLKIPRSDVMVDKIFEIYDKDREELGKISIKELEKEIDDRVYQLYGLDEEDIQIIENFLEKF